MENLALRLPPKMVHEIAEILFPNNSPEGSVLELVITLDSEDLSIRELNTYLSFVDNVYGRLLPEGIYSYAHNSDLHLKIREMKEGSIETILTDALIGSDHTYKLAIVFFTLKFLPDIIKASAEAVKNFAGAYKDFQEAETVRVERANRKNLRELIANDEKLHTLTSPQKEQFVKLLDSIYAAESKHLNPVIRIAKTKIKGLKLRRNKKL